MGKQIAFTIQIILLQRNSVFEEEVQYKFWTMLLMKTEIGGLSMYKI